LLENAFSVGYKAIFPKLIAKSDLTLYTNYDDVRWTYFFGLGNDSKFDHDNKLKYYTMRSRHWIVQPALVRTFGRSTVSVFGSVSGIKVINDTARFLNKVYEPDKSTYDWQTFAGAGISYSFQDLNDALVPTKGVFFNTAVTGAQNLTQKAIHYLDFKGAAYFYIPLSSKFSLNLRAGAETVTGNPEFYQYASIGAVIFRGAVRDRFRGKTAFYNTNDLRYISSVHTHLFAGKAGVQVFVDNGRVWLPGEESNTWHMAYGAGIILAPFNIAYADFNYGRSKNEGTFQVRVTFSIP
jgi:outer membrane protein assembly factor BamA